MLVRSFHLTLDSCNSVFDHPFDTSPKDTQ